jgi:hypothetical protein
MEYKILCVKYLLCFDVISTPPSFCPIYEKKKLGGAFYLFIGKYPK